MNATALLENYKPLEWPDLTAARVPGREPHSTTLVGTDAFSTPAALLVVAATRAIGVYCGSSDVLVAIQLDGDAIGALRVQWGGETRWDEMIKSVGVGLAIMQPGTLDELRGALDFAPTQMPCMALFTRRSTTAPGAFPLVVSYPEGTVHLESHEHHMHSSVSTLLASQIVVILEQATAHPTSLVSDLSKLPTSLMSTWERRSRADCAVVYDHMECPPLVTEHLAIQARKAPHRIVLNWMPEISQDPVTPSINPGETLTAGFPTHTLTFLQLDQRANQFARWLLSMGLQREDRVAICTQRDLNFHAALFGILRAGGCYVPIDAELDNERKRYIASDSEARFVLTASCVSAGSDLFGKVAIFLDAPATQSAIAAYPAQDLGQFEDLSLLATPDSLAFLLYTSGTTGNPKGCLCTNRGLAEAIWSLTKMAARARMADIREGRYLAVASIAFDVHLAETFTPIALGMQLFSAPRSSLFENLPFYIKTLRITHVGIVPSLIEATMGVVADEGDDMSLRYIASGGEKMSDAILEKWADHPKVTLANFYGPSEVTIGCCCRVVDKNTPKANIGTAFLNVGAYVVDDKLEILPRGGVGELVVEGPLVGKGYHGRPDLTSKVFLNWPTEDKWCYRTGDLVRMMPDSTFEILGRIDTQIKLRGVRIESEGISNIIRKAAPSSLGAPLEVTTVLAKHPDIGVEQLVSFISWDPSVSIGTRKANKPSLMLPPAKLLDTLREACAKGLASYMRPSHIVPLSWLALSSNGKVDAKVMTAVFNGLPLESLTGLMVKGESRQVPKKPLSELELQVVQVLSSHTTMPLESTHPDTNLFECGLDSLAVIRFCADLRLLLGSRIAVSDVMVAPTVGEVASSIQRKTSSIASPSSTRSLEEFSHTWSTVIAKEHSAVERVLPPFPVQQGVLYRSLETPTLYVQHVLLKLRRGNSMASLRFAWEAVVAEHPILRTVFYFGKALVQVVFPQGVALIPWKETSSVVDPSLFPDWFRSSNADDLSTEINANIATKPAFRLTAFTHPDDSYLVLSIHHALYDGIALPALLEAVELRVLSEPPRPSADLPQILELMSTVDMNKARQFWCGQFDSFHWPSQTMRLASSTQARHMKQPFTSSLSSLKKVAASQHVTLQALLTYAFAKLLASQLYENTDVVFGVIRSGRMLPIDNVDAAICPMISVLPARVNFGAHPVLEVLQAIQQNISSVVELEHVPLGKVQNWVREGATMFETLFSMSMKETRLSTIWDAVESNPPNPDYMLAVEVVIDTENDALVVQAAYTPEDLSETFISTVLSQFESVALEAGAGAHTELAVTSHARLPQRSGSTQPVDVHREVDPALVGSLRDIISAFLCVPKAVLTEAVSFVSLGLDSIQTISLSRALRTNGHDVLAGELMRYSTVYQLAQLLSTPRDSESESVDPIFEESLASIRACVDAEELKLAPEDVVTVFPTTVLQSGMLSQTVASQGELYVHAFPLLLNMDVSPHSLRGAWSTVVETFGILRTTFHLAAELGVWVQAVHSMPVLNWSEETYGSSYEDDLHRFISSINLREDEDFSRPPAHARLFNGPNEQSRLVIVMHHSLYDGIAIGKLLHALEMAYRGQDFGPITQFTDILGHFSKQERSGTPFWVDRLRGHNLVRIPECYDGEITSHVVSHQITLDQGVVEILCRNASITVQCLGQAAWAKALGLLVESDDVVFGHIISGRSIPGAEDVIGPLLNTIPCRVTLLERQTNLDLLQNVHEANTASLPWQQASLRAVQKELGIPMLWESLFSFQPLEKVDSSKELLWEFDTSTSESVKIQYPLNLELYQATSGFSVSAACNSNIMTYNELVSLVRRFEALLRHILLHPEAAVLDDVPEARQTKSNPLAVLAKLDFYPPTTAIPPVLREILASSTKLPVDRVQPDTHLAALGIDSITAVQIVAKCRKAGLRLTAAAVIASTTVGDLAQKVTEIESVVAASPPPPMVILSVPPQEESEILSKFAMIEGISIAPPGVKWLIGGWQASGGKRFQHSFAFKLASNVDYGNLQYAWTALVRRHAILRSTFATALGGDPRLVTFNVNHHVDWCDEKLASEQEGDDTAALHERMKSLLESPPSLNRPQTRAVLLRGQSNGYLVLHLHHFQYDAWSLRLLLDDLASFYRGVEASSSNDLKSFIRGVVPSPLQLEEQKLYWTTSFPSPFVPTLLPSTEFNSTGPRTILVVKAALTQASVVESKARGLGLSLQAIFLACWARIQASLTSSDAATFGLWHAGRGSGIDDIERMAVPCMNVLPMHIAGTSMGVIELARKIQDDLRRRTGVVEQSDLVAVDEWVGGGGKALHNVFVNVVKVAPEVWDVGEGEPFLEPVSTPHFTPENVAFSGPTTVGKLPVSSLVQDDVMIDIATLENEDTILMSIEAASNILAEAGAKDLVERWSQEMKLALGL